MKRRTLWNAILTFCAVICLTLGCVFMVNGNGSKVVNAEPVDYTNTENIADSVYDFTFTGTSSFVSRWGNQEATLTVNNTARTMTLKAGQTADGVMEMGSYHTKFDIKIGAGDYFSIFLRHNSGTRAAAPGAYFASNIDTGEDCGYRMFLQNQYIQFMETKGSANNSIANSAPFYTDTPFGADRYFTFEIWVLNLVDGSVQFVVNVDGTTYINENTSDIQNSLFETPLTKGALRLANNGVETQFRGYDSEANRRMELFTEENFANWTGNGGAAGNAPMSWVNGGYQIGEFDTLAGWPETLTKATTLVGSSTVGSFSSVFTFNGGLAASDATVPYNLVLSYLQPGVKNVAWVGTTQSGFLHEGAWVNGYILWINNAGSVELLKGTNDGQVKQMRWSAPSINFADGSDHTFYFSVQNSPDRSYQIVTLDIDGVNVVDFHSYMPITLMGANKTELTAEEQAVWLQSCEVGSFQIVTQNLKGTFLNKGDNDFANDYFETDMTPVANNPSIETGITLENGTLFVPRGDKNGTDGNGYHWQEQVPVVTKEKISANSLIAFDFSAKMIEGKTAQLFMSTNNVNQYKSAAADGQGDEGVTLYFDANGVSVLDAGGWGAVNLLDGQTHRVVISSVLNESGLTLTCYSDGKKIVTATFTDVKFFHDGYFNMFARGLDEITISNVSVYEHNYNTAARLVLNGTPKTEYVVGDELDVSGITVRAIYADGTYKDVAVNADMVSGFTTETASEQLTLTVAYAGATATYDVVVDAGNMPSYKLQEGYKKIYQVGESYANDMVIAKLFQGETTQIPVTADMISGFDTTLGGEVELTITVEEYSFKTTIKVEKQVSGVSVVDGYQTDYAIGAKLNYENLKGKLAVSYNDGTTGTADITADMLSVKGLSAGENVVTVTYCGYETEIVLNGIGADSWDDGADAGIRANLAQLNVAGFKGDSLTQVVGDTVAFGGSVGAFITYATEDKYDGYRMTFDSKIAPEAADANQRIMLRASVADNDLMNGYFMLLYKSNWQLFKKPTNSAAQYGYMVMAGAFADSIGTDNVYDNTYHTFTIENFNRADGTVVFNMAIDGVYAMHFVDGPSVASEMWSGNVIPEADRRVFADAGFVGFTMNSSQSWMLKGEYQDGAFAADTYHGNSDIYGTDSTATITDGKTTFENGSIATVGEEKEQYNAEFDLTFADVSGDMLFATAVLSSRANYTHFDRVDGILFTIYSTYADVTFNGKTIATIKDIEIDANEAANVKIAVNVIGGEVVIGFCIAGEWVSAYLPSNIVNTSGYVSMFAFTDVELTAEVVEERNFRVLFVGNSITNHGPNADIGYSIGVGSDSWGMATSAPEFDYVHLVMAAIRQIEGYENAEYFAINVANWEREYASYDYAKDFADGALFEADLIIGRVSENANSCAASYKMDNDFAHYYEELLNFFNSKGTAQIILTTSYWGEEQYDRDSIIDAKIIELAREKNYPLVRLGDLGSRYNTVNDASADEEYYKGLEGQSPAGITWIEEWNNWSSDVKNHPGMNGMRNIAARISESVVALLTGNDANISVYDEIAENLYAEYTLSNLYGDVAGAYDYKKSTSVSASVITDFSGYAFSNNFMPYKGYVIVADGDIYRLTLKLDADIDALFDYKVYTVNAAGELVELSFYTDTESNPEAGIYVSGDIGDKIFFCIKYDAELIFQDAAYTDAKYGNLIKWYNKDSEKLVLDVSELGYDNLTIGTDVYSVIISTGKDLAIHFANGEITVTAETFEVIAETEDDLYFSVMQLTNSNHIKNATATVEALGDEYLGVTENEDGSVTSIYETLISYNGRSGNALYINKGVKVYIPVTLTEAQLENLVVISAVLPVLGSEVTNVEVFAENLYSYENGVLALTVKDFNSEIILAYEEKGIDDGGSGDSSSDIVDSGSNDDSSSGNMGDVVDGSNEGVGEQEGGCSGCQSSLGSVYGLMVILLCVVMLLKRKANKESK